MRLRLALVLSLVLSVLARGQGPSIEVIDPSHGTPHIVTVRLDGRYYAVMTSPVWPVGPIPPLPDPTPPDPTPPPKPTPDPIPTPTPPPVPYNGKLWAIYVADQGDGHAWSFAVNPMLRSALADSNTELRTFKTTEEDVNLLNLKPFIESVGGPPVLMLQRADTGKVVRVLHDPSVLQVVEAISQVRKGLP